MKGMNEVDGRWKGGFGNVLDGGGDMECNLFEVIREVVWDVCK